MNRHKTAIQKTVQRFVPDHKKATVIAERFEKHGESYFLFINEPTRKETEQCDPQIGPTNNVAEREIRTLVMDRLVTQAFAASRATNGMNVFGRPSRRAVGKAEM